MNYQFIFFEEHLTSLQTKKTFAKNYAVDTKKSLEREHSRLTRVFRDMAVELNTHDKLKAYFNFHQQNLTLLMDKASNEKTLREKGQYHKIIINTIDTLLDKMEEILIWMKQVFSQVFNDKGRVPIKMIESETSEIEDSLSLIIGELENKKLDKKLMEVIKKVLNLSQIISFKDLEFWKKSCSKIYQDVIMLDSVDEFSVIKIFIGFGINHPDLFLYAKRYISSEIENNTTLGEKISAVCLYRKEIRVLYRESQMLQFKTKPDLQRTIKKFLREELLLLRAIEFVNHEVEEAGIMNANYKVSFSVKQLAFFVHLQMETGIIIWQRAKFAHQYIARHFSTVERDSISEKSARNAHYNHASEDVRKVIAKLSEMLALAQERY
ncbi:hypothetical protein [Pedobacter endophyticus]|uniref:Uncharacterized protein n=1 Tax=Pedobacter endophyticus TaxID=2789740 RepID=A0A7U3Q4W9_9SPHI|nr:hypothetical protein [Pedobacter endophyticus]QPH38655.1 hypothetical protein IZT61_16450 [Pedobacter endophyticus]